MKEIFAYCGYTSPVAYLAKDPIFELEKEFDVVVQRPRGLRAGRLRQGGGTLAAAVGQGQVPLPRCAARREQAWHHHPRPAARIRRQDRLPGCTLCAGQGTFRPYNDIVFERFWNRDLDVDDPAAVAAVLEKVGTDTRDFAAFMAGPGAAEYEAIRDEAHARGVFGVPTLIVDGEPFWGVPPPANGARTADRTRMPQDAGRGLRSIR